MSSDGGGLYGSFLRVVMGLCSSIAITAVIAFAASGKSRLLPGEPWYVGGEFFNQTAVIVYICLYIFYRIGLHFIKSKSCEICNKKGSDRLVIQVIKVGSFYFGRRDKAYCRNHLMTEFQKGFVEYKHKMVVFHPDLETKKGTYTFTYLPMDEIQGLIHQNKKFSSKITERVKSSINMIQGKCSKCEKIANIAYYDQNTFEWDTAIIEDKPKILCNQCTYNKISFSLKNFKGKYSEGIVLPYEGEGMYIPILV